MSLEEFLLAKGISAEKILEIEYIKAIVPKREEEPSLHDDWVSSVDGSNGGYILTGCYDGFGRILRTGGICTHVLDGHSGPVTSVCILKPKGESANNQIVATASKDKALRLWKFVVEDSFDQPKNVRAFKILRGHTAAVQSISAEPSGEMVCSGSWDCTINLWNTNASQIEGNMVSLKKRKKNTEDEELQSEGEALSTLVGHTQCVSSVIWPRRETIYSASWDHSIRRWDVETGKDNLSMQAMETYIDESLTPLDDGTIPDHPSSDEVNSMFKTVVGLSKKGRMYGCGSMASTMYPDEMAPRKRGVSSSSSRGSQETERMREEWEQQRKVNEILRIDLQATQTTLQATQQENSSLKDRMTILEDQVRRLVAGLPRGPPPQRSSRLLYGRGSSSRGRSVAGSSHDDPFAAGSSRPRPSGKVLRYSSEYVPLSQDIDHDDGDGDDEVYDDDATQTP